MPLALYRYKLASQRKGYIMSNEDTPEAFLQRVSEITGKSVEQLREDMKRIADENARNPVRMSASQDVQRQTARRVYRSGWKR